MARTLGTFPNNVKPSERPGAPAPTPDRAGFNFHTPEEAKAKLQGSRLATIPKPEEVLIVTAGKLIEGELLTMEGHPQAGEQMPGSNLPSAISKPLGRLDDTIPSLVDVGTKKEDGSPKVTFIKKPAGTK